MTVWQARQQFLAQLEQAEVPNATFELKQLLQFVLGCLDVGLVSQQEWTDEQQTTLQQLVHRRIEGCPLQYLIEEWDFFGRTFCVGEGVLIPREDTEVLCEVALQHLQKQKMPRILDLCAGSGCIAITLAAECADSTVFAWELSELAWPYLNGNIKRHQSQVQAVQQDVLDPINPPKELDLIVSNPPYLNEQDMEQLQREVQFEPEMALYAPHNGYLFYEQLPRLYYDCLKIGGMLCFEVGIGQAEQVRCLMEQAGYQDLQITTDWQGIERVVSGIKKE